MRGRSAPSQQRSRRPRDAQIDWKAPSRHIEQADIAFTVTQYVQTDPEAGHRDTNALAELIISAPLAPGRGHGQGG